MKKYKVTRLTETCKDKEKRRAEERKEYSRFLKRIKEKCNEN